jgi:hypothetical protein
MKLTIVPPPTTFTLEDISREELEYLTAAVNALCSRSPRESMVANRIYQVLTRQAECVK